MTTVNVGEPGGEPMLLFCPVCQAQHWDNDEWFVRPHKTHRCFECGALWRPFEYPTTGVG